MRFSWIALPLLLSTLGGVEGVPIAPARTGVHATDTGTHYVGSAMALHPVAMPSTAGATELTRLGTHRLTRLVPPGGAQDLDVAGGPSRDARVRIRSVDRAGLDYLPELTRALTGFVSSRTTGCPPPSR